MFENKIIQIAIIPPLTKEGGNVTEPVLVCLTASGSVLRFEQDHWEIVWDEALVPREFKEYIWPDLGSIK